MISGLHEGDRRLVLAAEARPRGARSEPTCGAASPTPRASCMIADHPRGLVAQGVVEFGHRQGRRPQYGVADLADLLERGESPALQDGVVEGA